jgi:hypothetical protein
MEIMAQLSRGGDSLLFSIRSQVQAEAHPQGLGATLAKVSIRVSYSHYHLSSEPYLYTTKFLSNYRDS